MIAATYIRRNIKTLSLSYRKSSTPLKTLLYAKLAIIEVGGWVEMSMDDITQRAGRKIKNHENKKYLSENVIKRTYGFDYDANFRKMIIQTVGLISTERIEAVLDAGKHASMKAALGSLKAARNRVAHTYIKYPGRGAAIDAPSVSLAHFEKIYDGLLDLEKSMKRLGVL